VNYPNPFNPRTTIELTIPGSGLESVSVAIYDPSGRRVTTLFEGKLPAGTRNGLSWDGRDAQGRPLPSGIYFAQARIGRVLMNHKMVLLR
jgi:flagellar hook assembly protein FlgD